MQTNRLERREASIAGLWMGLAVTALVALVGCNEATRSTASAPPLQVAGQPGQGQTLYASVDEAVAGLMEAVKTRDEDKDAMRKVFGPATEELVSGDPVEDARAFEHFAQHATEQHRVAVQADGKAMLHIGKGDWPFPIPLVKTAGDKWFFDTAAGKQEVLARRIGANELATIAFCRTYVLAQREYAAKDRDGSGVLKYAQRFRSMPGKKDGLFWEAAPGEEQSPLGPLVADASLKGYDLDKKGAGRQPFQGYYFHILTRQGPAAPGGRYDYVINGNMIAGFALVASPDKYGSSGVMTFLISHSGKLYQKDLGPNTLEIVKQMTEYDPDSRWTLVKD
jgi:hypothetical protein